MVVTNTGTAACQQDVSGTLQIFTVTAPTAPGCGPPTDCFPGEGTEVRELAAGAEREVHRSSGPASTSMPGCAGERVTVPAGDYTVVAQLGGLSSAPPPFTITG